MTETTHLEQELDLCTMSPEGFKVLTPKVLETIKKDNWYYRDFFLEKLTTIITSKTNSPLQRFYALYLLFKSTEAADRIFFEKLAKCDDLLNFIGRAAQHDVCRKIALDARGFYFFSPKPTRSESRMGLNFVRLCLEILLLCHQRCDEKTPGNPCYIFSFYALTIKKKLLVPIYYHFINRNFNLSQDIANWDFGNDLPPSTTDISAQNEQSIRTGPKTTGARDIVRVNTLKKSAGDTGSDRPGSIENGTDDSGLSEDKGLILSKQMPNNSGFHQNSAEPQRRTSTAFLGTIDPKYKSIADNTIESPSKVGKLTPKSLIKEVVEDRKVMVNKDRYNKLKGLVPEAVQPKESGLKKVSSMPCGLTAPHYYTSQLSRDYITSLGDIQEENAPNDHYNTLKPQSVTAIPRRSLRTLNSHPAYSPLKTSGSSQIIVFSMEEVDEVPNINDVPNEIRHTPVKVKRPQDKIAMELLEIQNSIMKSQTRSTKDTLGSIKSIPEVKEKFERNETRSFTSPVQETFKTPNNPRKLIYQHSVGAEVGVQSQQQSYSAAFWGTNTTSLGEIMDKDTDLRKVRSNQEGSQVESKMDSARSIDLDDKKLKERDDRVRRLYAAYAANTQKESEGSSKNTQPEARNAKVIHRAQSGYPYVSQEQKEEMYVRSKLRHESEKVSMDKYSLQQQRTPQENPQGRLKGLISLLSSTLSAWQEDD